MVKGCFGQEESLDDVMYGDTCHITEPFSFERVSFDTAEQIVDALLISGYKGEAEAYMEVGGVVFIVDDSSHCNNLEVESVDIFVGSKLRVVAHLR